MVGLVTKELAFLGEVLGDLTRESKLSSAFELS